MSLSVFRAKEENKIKQTGKGSGNHLPEAILLLPFYLASCSSSMQPAGWFTLVPLSWIILEPRGKCCIFL
jgi:hypothetical protein